MCFYWSFSVRQLPGRVYTLAVDSAPLDKTHNPCPFSSFMLAHSFLWLVSVYNTPSANTDSLSSTLYSQFFGAFPELTAEGTKPEPGKGQHWRAARVGPDFRVREVSDVSRKIIRLLTTPKKESGRNDISFIHLPLVKRLLARCLGRNVVAGKRTTNSEKRTERKSIKMMKLGRPPDATDRENQPAATDRERVCTGSRFPVQEMTQIISLAKKKQPTAQKRRPFFLQKREEETHTNLLLVSSLLNKTIVFLRFLSTNTR